MAIVAEAGVPVLLSASGVVSNSGGTLLGFFCNSTSSGTVVIRGGNTSSSTAISGTITPSAGTFYRFPASLPSGCYATIANTLSVTFFFQAG